MNTNVVGKISFDGFELDVYSDLNEPLFKGSDIGKILDYSDHNTWALLDLCEDDEKLKLPLIVSGQRRSVRFVTESGLYNCLAQSRKPIARKFRRVIANQLIKMRKDKGMDIKEQFDEWDHQLDDIYFDEETGKMMQSVTVAGGDVEQVEIE